MTTKPEEYRTQALHCRLIADQVESHFDKEVWLRLAADWLKMASIHERIATGQTMSETEHSPVTMKSSSRVQMPGEKLRGRKKPTRSKIKSRR
jgi:hypothetical protein